MNEQEIKKLVYDCIDSYAGGVGYLFEPIDSEIESESLSPVDMIANAIAEQVMKMHRDFLDFKEFGDAL